MKSSVSPLVFATMALAVSFFVPSALLAQDTLILTNDQRREGSVLGVKDQRVRFKAGPLETAIPLDQITAVRMDPPEKFLEALEAWQAADTTRTLSLLKPLIENYRGLPAPWMERASALLGTVLVESGDTDAAAAAFAEFQETYPQAQGLAELGLARLALARGDTDDARTRIEPIVETARTTLLPDSTKSSEFAQALHLMGQILEQDGALSDALEHYMLVTTVFYQDAAVATKARERADTLANEKNSKVP
jgi:tetratricopeptide (TPR) repeat protein